MENFIEDLKKLNLKELKILKKRGTISFDDYLCYKMLIIELENTENNLKSSDIKNVLKILKNLVNMYESHNWES